MLILYGIRIPSMIIIISNSPFMVTVLARTSSNNIGIG